MSIPAGSNPSLFGLRRVVEPVVMDLQAWGRETVSASRAGGTDLL